MNERIRDLIKAAGGIGHDDDGQELTPMLVGSGIEKFAEEIVRECAHLVDTLNEAYGAPSTAGKFIKEQFGLK